MTTTRQPRNGDQKHNLKRMVGFGRKIGPHYPFIGVYRQPWRKGIEKKKYPLFLFSYKKYIELER